MVKPGCKKHINVLDFTAAPFATMTHVSKSESNSLANGQHGGTFLRQTDRGYPQQGSFRTD